VRYGHGAPRGARGNRARQVHGEATGKGATRFLSNFGRLPHGLGSIASPRPLLRRRRLADTRFEFRLERKHTRHAASSRTYSNSVPNASFPVILPSPNHRRALQKSQTAIAADEAARAEQAAVLAAKAKGGKKK
jgi:hypothetical protein